MVPVRRVERADTRWIWCGLHLLAKRKADQRREDGSEYDISTSHNLVFLSVVLAFSDFSLARRPALENFRVAPRTRGGPGSIVASQFRPYYAISYVVGLWQELRRCVKRKMRQEKKTLEGGALSAKLPRALLRK